jgi:DNA polymerase-3 subunit gamma/tau
MTYTALYRRFRPQFFNELVGQPHISRTLAAAVKKGAFVHAYLFCGPRGTGKTSTAKIVARAVNCLEPTAAGEPCGSCPACLRNAQGESIDILEIDAASNRGIDEIRDLRERVKYAPVLEKFKVYIIDEVHMLTTPAFNALLKTLEEPPPHVLFILATTEPHKIPLTVLSRCQRFDFRRIADAEVEEHLQRVADEEGYTAEREALALIARKVEGGLRDALSLLDQCAGASGGQITLDVLQMLIGAAGRDFIEAMARHMAEGETAELLTGVAKLYSSGHDLRQFMHDLLEYLRELLLQKLTPAGQNIPPWAANVQPALLLKLLTALAEGEARLRSSLQPRLSLELTLLEAGGGRIEARNQRPEGVAEEGAPQTEAGGGRIEARNQRPEAMPPKLEAGGGKTEDRGEKPAAGKTAPPAVTEDVTPPELETRGQNVVDGAPQTETRGGKIEDRTQRAEDRGQRPEGVAEEEELARLQALWPGIVQAVSRANNSTGAFLAEAKPVSLQQNKLLLCFGAPYALFMNNICKQGKARKLVEAQIAELFGRNLSLEGTLAQSKDEPPPPPEIDQVSLFD